MASVKNGSRTGRSAALALAIVLISCALGAQQTIFNVPTADILDRGKLYFEEDTLWRPADPRFATFTMRGVYGLGAQVEAGVNFGGFITPGRSVPVAVAAVKWQPVKAGGFALTAGAHGLFFLRGSEDGDPAGHFYAHASYAFPTQTRVTAGGWYSTAGYSAADDTAGGLFGLEQKLSDHFSLDADWYTGPSSIGYFSPGLISYWGKWTVYTAYSFKNGERKGDGILLELGFSF